MILPRFFAIHPSVLDTARVLRVANLLTSALCQEYYWNDRARSRDAHHTIGIASSEKEDALISDAVAQWARHRGRLPERPDAAILARETRYRLSRARLYAVGFAFSAVRDGRHLCQSRRRLAGDTL